MAKKQKLPPLSNDTKILSFDLETNDLHGQAFAIGGVVIDANGKTLDEFSGRINVVGKLDPWVKDNVLPAIENMQINYKTYEELKEAFWHWYLEAEPKSDYVVVSNGYPVEYRFLLECQGADLENRYWQHPFPILDLSSLILQTGQNKRAFVKEFLEGTGRKSHNPLDDATVTALAAFKAFRKTGQIV